MKTSTADAVVIGSGFGGAVTARRLQESGYQVTILEKGPRIDPSQDFKQTQDPKYLLQYLKGIDSQQLGLTYVEAYGGGSGFYEMVSLRTPEIAFEQVDERTGVRLWPKALSRQAFDPHYEVAEQAVHATIPDWDRLPRAGAIFHDLLLRAGLQPERVKHAEQGCIGSGYCITGCIYGAKQSMLVTHLPAAEEAGATIITDADVLYIGRANHRHYRYEVYYRDKTTGENCAIQSKIVVLAGGVVGSASVLLRSRDELPLLSRQVGKNVASNGMTQAMGLLPDDAPDNDMYSGRAHSGIACYDLLSTHGMVVSAINSLPLYMMSKAHISLEGTKRFWGREHAELMQKIRHRALILYSTGLMQPNGRIFIGTNGQQVVDSGDRDVTDRYYTRSSSTLRSLLIRLGCTPLRISHVDGQGMEYPHPHIGTTHMTGSCRMADSIEHGVCDVNGEVFNYEGLFVADSSALPSSLGVNPSLTIMANAERIVPAMIRALRQ